MIFKMLNSLIQFLMFMLLTINIANANDDTEDNIHKSKLHKRKLVYNQRDQSGSKIRIDSSSRGNATNLPSLYILAPNHIGLTINDQPSLFWYQSKPCDFKFEMTLVIENVVQPIMEFNLPKADKIGIQRLNLEELGTKLSLDVEYRWTAALIPYENDRSKDIISSGTIKRISPPEQLLSKIIKRSKEDLVYIYAEEGIWFDALEVVSELIERNPDNHFRELRSALLEQADLEEAAAYDIVK